MKGKKIIKLTESDLHRIVKRVINESQSPPNKVSAGKRCWYYNKIAGKKYDVDNRVPNPFNGAGGVQDFLIALGWNITKDWDFGNQTAKALSFWRYGAKSGIDTVNKLWLQLKKDGYDVGEKTGYGLKMKKAVAEMIVKTCGEISKMCKVDAQTLFDMDFKIPKEDVKAKYELIPKTLDDSFKYAIRYWREYLKKPEVQQKIWENMSTFDFLTNYSLSSLMEKYFNALDTTEKKGWIDSSTSAEEEEASMYVNGDCPDYTVCVNVTYYYKEVYKKIGMRQVSSRSEDTFVHEIQHILWRKVRQLNSSISIKQAFPSSVDRYSTLIKGEEPPPIENLTKNGIENWSNFYKVSEETKKELKDLGISYDKLIETFSRDKYDSYVCDENEKLSNLAGYRSYLTDNGTIKLGGDIPIDAVVKHTISFINDAYVSVPSDFQFMIICWVIGGMRPKLSVFVNELNDLAQKELKPKDDDPTQIDNNLV
jgi:hypothetical protein